MQTKSNLFEVNSLDFSMSPEVLADDLVWFSTDIFGQNVFCSFERRTNYLSQNWDTRKSENLHFDERITEKSLQETTQLAGDNFNQTLLLPISAINSSIGSLGKRDPNDSEIEIEDAYMILHKEISTDTNLNSVVDKYANDKLDEYIENCPVEFKSSSKKYTKRKCQINILLAIFADKKKWRKKDWEKIAIQTGLTINQIYKWYLNFKAKLRKEKIPLLSRSINDINM